MSAVELQSLLMEGEKLVAALKLETDPFPTELQRVRDEDVVRLMTRRQELVTAIQNFDSDCTRFIGRSASTAEQLPTTLTELRERLGRALARTIEADCLLLALVEREKARLKTELTAIVLGQRALCGYGTKKERRLPAALNRTA
jgi:hypothetical protein